MTVDTNTYSYVRRTRTRTAFFGVVGVAPSRTGRWRTTVRGRHAAAATRTATGWPWAWPWGARCLWPWRRCFDVSCGCFKVIIIGFFWKRTSKYENYTTRTSYWKQLIRLCLSTCLTESCMMHDVTNSCLHENHCYQVNPYYLQVLIIYKHK